MKYGVRFDGINSAGVRLYDAENLVWERSSNTVAGRDDFASLPPFNVKECITQYNSSTGKREVLAYKGDSNWDSLVTAKTGDRMIEIPCFWYSRPSRYEFIVSDRPEAGFKPSPMHYRKGRLYSKIRISKYNIDGNYASQTGNSPLVNTNMNTFRNNFRAKGWYMLDYPTWCSLVMMMCVKYANMDVQATVGFGNSGSSSVYNSGGTDNVLGLDGSATSVSITESVLTFGIENLYGNIDKYIDGSYTYNGKLYCKDVVSVVSDPVNLQELLNDYVAISDNFPIDASNTPIKTIVYSEDYDWMQFPVENGTPNPSGDAYWSNGNFNLVTVGGDAWDNYMNGLFAFYATLGVSSISVRYGALSIELVPNELNVYIDKNKDAYGVSNNSFTNLFSNYDLATDIDKLLVHTTIEDNPTTAQIYTLDMPINIEAGNDESVARYCHLYALPKGQVVTSDTLTTLESNMKISCVDIEGKGNIKIAITKDGNIYQIYNFADKVWETIDINDIVIKGMSITDVSNISDIRWEEYNPSELGFAFYLNQENIEDEVEVSKITINYFS